MSENDPHVWLEFAERDRRAARNTLNAADYWDAAFHCQQAIEKLLKAAIVNQTGRKPPYTHNLWILVNEIQGIVIPDDIMDALGRISAHYTATRYPIGVLLEGYEDEESAIELHTVMEEVYQWLMSKLNLSGA